MKKLIYSALATGAALAVAFGASANVSANEEDATPAAETQEEVTAKSAVQFRYILGDTLYLDAGESKEVLVGTAKVKKKTQLAVSAWDTYVVDDGEVAVDLSKFANTKDNYIQVKADLESDDDALTFVLPASDKLKATYDKGKGTVSIQTADKNKSAYKNKALTYYTTSGVNSMENYVETDSNGVVASFSAISMYQMTGAAVYFESVPDYEAEVKLAALKIADQAIVQSDEKTPVQAYTLPARASKAVKVTIAKSPNAPKVKADYVNAKIVVPKNTQYRVVKDTLGDFAEAKDKVELKLGTTDEAGKTIDGSTAFAIDVYTKGDGNKKADSKIGHYTFKKQAPTESSKITYKTEVATKGGVAVTTAIFSNSDKDNAYYITCTANGKETSKKIAANKTDGLKVAKIDLSAGIKVQRIGNAKTSDWGGTIVPLVAGSSDSGSGGSEQQEPETPTVEKYSISIPDGTATEAIASIKVGEGDGTGYVLGNKTIEAGTKVVITMGTKTGQDYDENEGDNVSKVKSYTLDGYDNTAKTLTIGGTAYSCERTGALASGWIYTISSMPETSLTLNVKAPSFNPQ